MSTLAVFDIDGVLADTRPVVRDAYALAGVQMPDDAWGKPWREWLLPVCGGDEDAAAKVHADKTALYRSMVAKHGVPELPAAAVVRDLIHRDRPVLLVTSAARRAASAVLQSLKIDLSILGGTYLTLEARTKLVTFWARGRVHGAYFDDHVENAFVVAMIPHFTFHHITDDTTYDGLQETLRWTQ